MKWKKTYKISKFIYYKLKKLTRANVSPGSSNVNLFLLSDFICSTTKLKCSVACRQSFVSSEVTTSWTVVHASYLNDFVWPFSKNTFSTLAIGGTHRSPNENADGCNRQIHHSCNFHLQLYEFKLNNGLILFKL